MVTRASDGAGSGVLSSPPSVASPLDAGVGGNERTLQSRALCNVSASVGEHWKATRIRIRLGDSGIKKKNLMGMETGMVGDAWI